MDKVEKITMEIVAGSGNAKSSSMEAIACAKAGDMDGAERLLELAAEELTCAHKAHTELIQLAASGAEMPSGLLVGHAQDHLMTALLLIDLAKEFVDLYKRLPKAGGTI